MSACLGAGAKSRKPMSELSRLGTQEGVVLVYRQNLIFHLFGMFLGRALITWTAKGGKVFREWRGARCCVRVLGMHVIKFDT